MIHGLVSSLQGMRRHNTGMLIFCLISATLIISAHAGLMRVVDQHTYGAEEKRNFVHFERERLN